MISLAQALLLSTLSLGAGLGLVFARDGRPRLRGALDGFVVGVIPTLVLVHVVPHLWTEIGALSIGLVAIGFGALLAMEHAAGEHQGLRERVAVGVLVLHALLDGAVLAAADRLHLAGTAALLTTAIIIHRLPEGLVVAALLQRHGFGAAAIGASLLASATVLGALAGRGLLSIVDSTTVHVGVALSMGALLRVVLHDHSLPNRHGAPRALAFAVGAALAIGVPDVI